MQKLKEESWEAELLISTISIFGSLQLFKLIDWAAVVAFNRLPPSQHKFGFFILFLIILGVSILTTMFIIHFFLRTYWVGLVGLNSVFPDYGLKDSAYAEIYTKKILTILPRLKKTIGDVDELCSVIFSAAFLMLFIYINPSLIALILLTLYNLLADYISNYVLYASQIILGILFLFATIIMVLANLKKFRQNEKIQHLYFNSVKWSSMIFIGPLYKYYLQMNMTFASNFKKKKSLVYLTSTIILIGAFVSVFQMTQSRVVLLDEDESILDNTQAYSSFYADKKINSEFLITPQIDSDIIESDILRLFIPVYFYERSMHKDLCSEKTKSEDKTEISKWALNCYRTYHHVFLNGERIHPDFLKYELPETGQFGIITYLDLVDTKRGNNVIKVAKNTKDSLVWEIPFQWVGRR